MAHQLHIHNGEASMFYVGETPWHGLGTELDKPSTAVEAIRAAKLDYEVIKQPVLAGDGGFSLPIPDRFAVVRKDLWGKQECPVFGIVSGSYTPLQNRKAFEFFDPIVGKGAAIYHTAGALGQGERVWILAKLPTYIRVAGDDISNKFLLLSNSHDGNSSVQIKFTPIRVVCANTLTMALTEGRSLRVTHARDIHRHLQDAERNLGLINERFDAIEKEFQEMVKVHLTSKRLEEYLGLVFPDPEEKEDEKALKRAKRNRLWSEHFFVNGEGNKAQAVAGTLWAAYNGVTEYIDHRATKQAPDQRLESVWFGNGYLVKARALRIAERKMEAWLN